MIKLSVEHLELGSAFIAQASGNLLHVSLLRVQLEIEDEFSQHEVAQVHLG